MRLQEQIADEVLTVTGFGHDRASAIEQADEQAAQYFDDGAEVTRRVLAGRAAVVANDGRVIEYHVECEYRRGSFGTPVR